MPIDQKTFAIIIIITTIVSYLIIRKFFKIAPRFLLYGIIGIFVGLGVGVSIAWPASKMFGEFGLIVSPYILGIILMVFVEVFIIEGRNILKRTLQKAKSDQEHFLGV